MIRQFYQVRCNVCEDPPMQDYHHMWESELAAEEVAKTAGWLIRSHQPQIDRDFLVDLCPECQVAEAIRTVSEEPWEE